MKLFHYITCIVLFFTPLLCAGKKNKHRQKSFSNLLRRLNKLEKERINCTKQETKALQTLNACAWGTKQYRKAYSNYIIHGGKHYERGRELDIKIFGTLSDIRRSLKLKRKVKMFWPEKPTHNKLKKTNKRN